MVGLCSYSQYLDRLERVAALLHVTLNLPGELNLVRDVEVDREIHELAHTLVVERVKALDDHDVGRLDLLRGVKRTFNEGDEVRKWRVLVYCRHANAIMFVCACLHRKMAPTYH